MDVHLKMDDNGHGGFYLSNGTDRLGEMEVSISGKTLTVYHTEVAPHAEGKGFAKKLLDAMVNYARKEKLEVIPLCPFVHAQFQRHPKEYADILKR